MQRVKVGVVLFFLIFTHIFSLGIATEKAKLLPQEEGTTFILPSPILRLTALDYRGLASDFMFLKALVFIGSTFERKERPRVKAWEWKWLYNVLDASSGLDPYFFDSYYFANANLTWEGRLIRETNTLLEKGSRYRDWDWVLPFYIGFNKYYFLNETDTASEFMMEASRRPGGSPLMADLAAKFAYKGEKTQTAIFFLEELLIRTENKGEREYYETRLESLKAIQYLEAATATYKVKFGKAPSDLNELVAKKLITRIPKDPYDGKYYISPDGAVKTTSESLLLPYHPK